MELYNNIRKRRIKLGLTQEALANKLGYKTKSMICKIEAGKVDLSQSKILAFAHALMTTPGALMGTDSKPSTQSTKVDLVAGIKAITEMANMSDDFSLSKVETITPDFERFSDEELKQERRNAIARAFLDIMLQGSPEAQAIIARATVTADGDITLPGLDAGGQKYINKMRAAFIEAVQDATKEGSINKVTLKIEPPQK